MTDQEKRNCKYITGEVTYLHECSCAGCIAAIEEMEVYYKEKPQ